MTADELIADSFGRLPHTADDVRKAALLCIARVQTVIAPESAEQTLMAGWSADHNLSARFDAGFLYLTRLATAAVAPSRLSALAELPEGLRMRGVLSESRILKLHGHDGFLRHDLLQSADLKNLSLEALSGLLADSDHADEQRDLLTRMVEAWQAQMEVPGARPWEFEHIFEYAFRDHWHLLPPARALSVVQQMVNRIVSQRDQKTNGSVQNIRFTSLQSLKLFQIYDLILELLPEQAVQLAKKKRELGRALNQYPKGRKSIREEVLANIPPRERSDCDERGEVVMFGSKQQVRYGSALLAARNTGDFSMPFRWARAAYMYDNGPQGKNFAPKAFWPSTAMYRQIFYQMAACSKASQEFLNQTPDREIRLLAQVELAAGLSGLPELTWTTQRVPVLNR